MKIKDFKISQRVIKESKLKGTHGFCECCFDRNPEMEDGYTTCCNELNLDKDEAIKNAKAQDIYNFLNTKFKCTSYEGMNRNYTIFELTTKKVKFELNMNNDLEDLINKVVEKIKGLRKEK